jgi:hypothetical protein
MTMKLDPEELTEMETAEIIRELVEYVTKTKDEVDEKETRGGKTPNLKIFIADNRGYETGELTNLIEELVLDKRVDANARRFFNDHPITETTLDEKVSFVEITSPEADRTSEFVFITHNGYLWVLTTELRDWTKETVERLISYIPSLERLYLSADDLRGVTDDLDKSRISGFTAKYSSQHRDRDATLRLHGAEEGDLETAKEAFNASPSRIEFDQANSPDVAVQGSHSNDGVITVENVVKGAEDLAVETAQQILGEYEQRDFQSYEVENPPERREFEDWFLIDGFTGIELVGSEREDEAGIAEELENEVLNSTQYEYGRWGEETFFVHDKDHGEVFELGIEGTSLVLHTRQTTTALCLRSFCQRILDDFDSTYTIQKQTVRVSGA